MRFFLCAQWMGVPPWELVEHWDWFERGEFYRETWNEVMAAKKSEVT